MWVLRLSLAWGRPPREVEALLTAPELAELQALVEIDGPFWGEREAAHLRQLCAVQAAAAGASIPPEEFELSWSVGPRSDPPANLLPPGDGLAIFAGRYGLDLVEVPADPPPEDSP